MKTCSSGTRQTGATVTEIITYILIAITIAAVILGKYVNSSLDKAITEALAVGEAQKAMIEEYFSQHGQMPQSGADVGLEQFTPTGVLKGLTWQPGALGEGDSDTLLTGTLNGLVTLGEFGKRFEEFESAYLLIARAQDDGTIIWDCQPDRVTPHALPGRYLPEVCEKVSKDDDKEEMGGDF